jgi:hypothetical protein
LYKNRLNKKGTSITEKVEIDWLKIKQAINETAEESIGYKKIEEPEMAQNVK